MTQAPVVPIDVASLERDFTALGLPKGAVVMVHASLSAFGAVDGGAGAVIDALRRCVGDTGTVVVPTFTPQVADTALPSVPREAAMIEQGRLQVPLYHANLQTPMGAVANALLAHTHRHRGSHPQASVAAIGAHAEDITSHQSLRYALGKGSPFERMYQLGAYILLLGVGHNRNSFLHYAESLLPHHRTKLRGFPYPMAGERVWLEVPDVGDDNGRYFPGLGEAAEAAGLIKRARIGQADCQLMLSVPFVDFAKARFHEWLAAGP
jgi:aminoglycoside 3-N-acetyltransferase